MKVRRDGEYCPKLPGRSHPKNCGKNTGQSWYTLRKTFASPKQDFLCMYKRAHERVDFCGVNEWVGLRLTVGKEKCRPVSRAVAVAPRLCTPGNSKTSNSADFGNWGNLRRNRWQQIHSTSSLTVQLQIGSCFTTRRGQTDGLKEDKLGNHTTESKLLNWTHRSHGRRHARRYWMAVKRLKCTCMTHVKITRCS